MVHLAHIQIFMKIHQLHKKLDFSRGAIGKPSYNQDWDRFTCFANNLNISLLSWLVIKLDRAKTKSYLAWVAEVLQGVI